MKEISLEELLSPRPINRLNKILNRFSLCEYRKTCFVWHKHNRYIKLLVMANWECEMNTALVCFIFLHVYCYKRIESWCEDFCAFVGN